MLVCNIDYRLYLLRACHERAMHKQRQSRDFTILGRRTPRTPSVVDSAIRSGMLLYLYQATPTGHCSQSITL
ncbi:Uncharacterized protein HZ326_21075 [Fusarium oxysporum f. sp. albedinis]|nr:Uncharacterized protein HZ326_21075 [Fusarium oxysporum f. sp. albedinis]